MTGATGRRTRRVEDQIECALAEIRFGPDGLVPAIAQQHDTGEILMMAWMNCDAVRASLTEGGACHTGRRNCFFRAWRDGGWAVIAEPQILPEILYADRVD